MLRRFEARKGLARAAGRLPKRLDLHLVEGAREAWNTRYQPSPIRRTIFPRP